MTINAFASDIPSTVQQLWEWSRLTAERRGSAPSTVAVDAPRQAYEMLSKIRALREWLDEIERRAICDAQLCGATPDAIAKSLGMRNGEDLTARWPGCVAPTASS